ncbi:hypothetical protein D1007_58318 [Hordeum vulgare]|nr:hypothetical protein D1007_58318 [Hordeum vulgare]
MSLRQNSHQCITVASSPCRHNLPRLHHCLPPPPLRPVHQPQPEPHRLPSPHPTLGNTMDSYEYLYAEFIDSSSSDDDDDGQDEDDMTIIMELFRECLRRAKFIGNQQHNTGLLVNMVRQQFKKNMHETDPEKIQKMKDDAARGLINHIIYESEKMTGRKFSG